MIEASEFVKTFGWDLARRDVGAFSSGFIKREDFVEHYGFDILDELKTLVDAYELVEKFGGLFHAKVALEKEGFTGGIELDGELIEDMVLKQAIKLVESCQ